MKTATRTALTGALLVGLLHGCGDQPVPPATEVEPTTGTITTETEATAPTIAPAPDPAPAPAPAPTASGKQPVTVSEGTNLSFSLSPDGQTLVFSLQGVLFSMPASGGRATVLTDYYQDAREPVWNRDGSLIIYHGYRSGNWDLWSLPVSGGDPLPLTTDAFDDREPQVSPSGGQIAFSSDRSGNYDIWLLSVADGSLTQVTETPENESAPAWSPDGNELAYAVDINRQSAELRVTNLITRVTRTLASDNGSIAGISWRPDGNQVTYQNAVPGSTSLKILTPATGATEILSHAGDDVFPFRAEWSADGNLLYAANGGIQRRALDGTRAPIPFEATFELDRPGYERRRRDHDDTTPRQALGLSHPVISPNGQQIAFTALGDLWLWSPDSQTLTNVTDSPFAERSPRYSPDGNRIAYISDQGAGLGQASALWIYDIAQNAHTKVTLASTSVSAPAWSPDGGSIALFASIAGSPLASQLTVADLKDGSLTPVHTPLPAQGISWSSDGAYLATTELAPYSSRYREGVYQMIVTSPTTGASYRVEPVQHKSMTNVALAPFGQAMTYVQDGQLWQQGLSEDFQPIGYPEPLTANLTDTPSWSSGGEYIVYMNADRMMRLNVDTGAAEDITPPLEWRPSIIGARWTLKIGRLFDGTGEGYLEDVILTIDGNRIVSVEPAAAGVVADLDASDKAAFPGLFEMHGHMGEVSEPQGRAWLAWGITTVRDPGSDPYVAKERQEIWDSDTFTGPRTHVTGYLTDGNRVYYSVAEGVGSDVHLDRTLDRAGRMQLDFIKTYVRLPDHRQERVLEFAHETGIPVSSHELFPAAAYGMDHVEHIGGTSRRGYRPKVSGLGYSYGDVVALLAESGMAITPTAVLPGYALINAEDTDLYASPQFDYFYGPAGRQAAAMRASMFGAGVATRVANNGKFLKALTEAGALVVSGTDSPIVPFGLGLHAELRLYARAGLTPAQVLKTATVNAAKAAGVDHDIGTLKPGMIADLVIVDGDPLADIEDADNVVITVKNGRAYHLPQLLTAPGAD
jgi:Tol biopolymer transport system component/imidazolonepropionase-like amidohydrolase